MRSVLVCVLVFVVPHALPVAAPSSAETVAADPPFREVAAATGLDFVHFNGMSGERFLVEITGGGVALLDYDNDGDLDVYLVQGHMLGNGKSISDAILAPSHPLPLSDRLYRNDSLADGEFRFVDVTVASRIPPGGYGMGAATGDFDADGWADLYVTNFGSNRLLRNRGDGSFEDVTESSGADDPRWSVAASFFDFDLDGHLDLFVGNYLDFHFELHETCPSATGSPDYCGPLSYRAVMDRLLRNRGDGTFEDVSEGSGIAGAYGSALGATSEDFNGDGLPDLYVANDMVPNLLWTNAGGGRFEEDGLLSGAAVNGEGLPEASMGVDAVDFDDDGDVDLFLGHLAGETNTLYANDGAGLFRDSTVRTGLSGPSFQSTVFGTVWLDYNGDGRLDLATAAGAVTVIPALERAGDRFPLHQRNQLFRGTGSGTFEDVTERAGPAWQLSEVSRGIALGDIDNDGDPDLVIANNGGPVRLLENTSSFRCWSGIRARLRPGASDAMGSSLEVRAGDRSIRRRIRTDGSYASARDPRVLIAGDVCAPAALRIVSADGSEKRWVGPPGSAYLEIYVDSGAAAASGAS
ncbi:MAG: FG-GAP repeat domain-containing protein [Thermoanaerobaculia bacterium]